MTVAEQAQPDRENAPNHQPTETGRVAASAVSSARHARGVVPFQPDDPVMKSPYAHGAFVFATLPAEWDAAAVTTWLTTIDTARQSLRAARTLEVVRVATIAVGFGPSFFYRPDLSVRFAGVTPPAGFAQLPPMPHGAAVPADVCFYIVATAEAEIAKFVNALAASGVIGLAMEQGYKSYPDQEAFGYRDGVRNVPSSRNDFVFIDADRNAEEPDWTHHGSYLAYMRIAQNSAPFQAIPAAEQDQVIGRDRTGRRLDLPADTTVKNETAFATDEPRLDSHVRKVGPRGFEHRDETQIFRRGLPFLEVREGQVVQGLQFASFQASLDQFDAVFNRWMLNPDFPRPGTGVDALIARGLITIEKWGFYFVPPDTDGPIGIGMFAPAKETRKPKTGRVAVRKELVDANGTRVNGDLGGFTFQINDLQGNPVGAPFTSNSHGHALSGEITLGDYQLIELPPQPPQPDMPAAAPVPFALHSAQEVVKVRNQLNPTTGPYNG